MTGEVLPLHALLMGSGSLLVAIASASAVHPAALQARRWITCWYRQPPPLPTFCWYCLRGVRFLVAVLYVASSSGQEGHGDSILNVSGAMGILSIVLRTRQKVPARAEKKQMRRRAFPWQELYKTEIRGDLLKSVFCHSTHLIGLRPLVTSQATIVASVGLTSAYTPVIKPLPVVKNLVVAAVIAAAICSGGLAAGAGIDSTLAPAWLTFFTIGD